MDTFDTKELAEDMGRLWRNQTAQAPGHPFAGRGRP
jgi:hypothetical protein